MIPDRRAWGYLMRDKKIGYDFYVKASARHKEYATSRGAPVKMLAEDLELLEEIAGKCCYEHLHFLEGRADMGFIPGKLPHGSCTVERVRGIIALLD